jgi:hypothetical protein
MAAALVTMQSFGAAQPPPVATIDGGAVRVAFPDHILDRPDVRKQMASALTTTFVIVARSRGSSRPPRSRIEIRFDLWDGVYLVRRVEMGRASAAQRIGSLAELKKWWRSPVHVLDTAEARAAIDVQLLVLPFSAAEEGDARDWLEKSGGVGTESTGVVGAMIGTTIQARPIATLRWRIEASQ